MAHRTRAGVLSVGERAITGVSTGVSGVATGVGAVALGAYETVTVGAYTAATAVTAAGGDRRRGRRRAGAVRDALPHRALCRAATCPT